MGRGVDLTVTVIATMAAKSPLVLVIPALSGSRARNTKPSPFAATSKAETSKHNKHDGPVASMNPPLNLVPIAFSDYGGPGIGFEFYSTVVRPYFRVEGLREKEEAGGGSGWDARKKKSEFRLSDSCRAAASR